MIGKSLARDAIVHKGCKHTIFFLYGQGVKTGVDLMNELAEKFNENDRGKLIISFFPGGWGDNE